MTTPVTPIFFIYQNGFCQISLPPLEPLERNTEVINITSCSDGNLITIKENMEDAVNKLNLYIGYKITKIWCDSNEVDRNSAIFEGAEISKGNYGGKVIYLKWQRTDPVWNDCYVAMCRGDALKACICAENLPSGTTLADLSNPQGITLLHMAVATGHISVLKILLKRGFDINCQTDTGHTLLAYACMHGHLELVKYLVDNGASINITNRKNRKPIDLVDGPDRDEIIRILQNAQTNGQKTIDQLELELEMLNDDLNIFKANYHRQRKKARKYKKALEEITKMYKDTGKPVLDHWGMLVVARKALEDGDQV